MCYTYILIIYKHSICQFSIVLKSNLKKGKKREICPPSQYDHINFHNFQFLKNVINCLLISGLSLSLVFCFDLTQSIRISSLSIRFSSSSLKNPTQYDNRKNPNKAKVNKGHSLA